MTNIIDIRPRSMAKKIPRKYSLREYLQKEALSSHKHEFINGEITKMPYAKGPHNIISANISAQIIFGTQDLATNYVVFGSDQQIYFPSLGDGVYADALAVCEKPLYWGNDELLLINPLLVVEVLSKSTQRYDRTGKFEKYKTLDSFKEYVMIRQNECYAEVWYRERPGFWHETIVTDLDAMLPLQSLGIEISMKRIYRNISL